MARARIKDVADRAGVSSATVSMVLNNAPSRISEATAAAVRAAASELGYQPDLNARGLRTQRTQMIGFVSDWIATTPHAVEIIAGAQQEALARDHLMLIANTDADRTQEEFIISALQARRVDGYVYGSMFHRSGVLPEALRSVPVVGVDFELEGRVCFVPDEYNGARAAMEHLVAAGHRSIAHLRGRSIADASHLREQAVVDVLTEVGSFDPTLIVRQDDTDIVSDSDFGEWAGHQLLARAQRPTAVFAFNDAMAMGFFRAAAAAGLQIPHDISVVGYDDHELIATELRPQLTTVRLPHREMGRRAVEYLLDHLNEADRKPGPGDPLVHRLGCPLIVRETVRPLS